MVEVVASRSGTGPVLSEFDLRGAVFLGPVAVDGSDSYHGLTGLKGIH